MDIKLTEVSREEYREYLKKLTGYKEVADVTSTMAVMQTIEIETNTVVAQAMYLAGGARMYYIRKEKV